MENTAELGAVISIQWANDTGKMIMVNWSGGINSVQLPSGETSSTVTGRLNAFQVLEIVVFSDSGEKSEPNLLFVGPSNVASSVLQQIGSYGEWETLNYVFDAPQDYYLITFATNPSDGLVIVGTVELTDPIVTRV